MLRAYFDESGLQGAATAFVLAGYLAPDDEWDKKFEQRWGKLLSHPCYHPIFVPNAGVICRPLEYIRATELEGVGMGRFRRIGQRNRDYLKNAAADCVIDCGLIAIGAGVLMQPYNKLITGKIREISGTPYELCFQKVVLDVFNRAPMFLGQDPNEGIAYTFDRHPRFQKLIDNLWVKCEQQGYTKKYRMGSRAAFEDKTNCKPLQAADHLAYETYHLLSGLKEKRPILDKFMNKWPQLQGQYFDEAGLRSYIEELRKAGKI